jgi:hypothetical protein
MRIDYELNKQDYIDFNIYYFKHSEILKKTMFYQKFILSIIFLIAPFIFARVSDVPF